MSIDRTNRRNITKRWSSAISRGRQIDVDGRYCSLLKTDSTNISLAWVMYHGLHNERCFSWWVLSLKGRRGEYSTRDKTRGTNRLMRLFVVDSGLLGAIVFGNSKHDDLLLCALSFSSLACSTTTRSSSMAVLTDLSVHVAGSSGILLLYPLSCKQPEINKYSLSFVHAVTHTMDGQKEGRSVPCEHPCP